MAPSHGSVITNSREAGRGQPAPPETERQLGELVCTYLRFTLVATNLIEAGLRLRALLLFAGSECLGLRLCIWIRGGFALLKSFGFVSPFFFFVFFFPLRLTHGLGSPSAELSSKVENMAYLNVWITSA